MHEVKLLSCQYSRERDHGRDHGLSGRRDRAYGPSGYDLRGCDPSDRDPRGCDPRGCVPNDHVLHGRVPNGCDLHDCVLSVCVPHGYGRIYASCSLYSASISNSSYWSVHDPSRSPSPLHHGYPSHCDHGRAPTIAHASAHHPHEVYYKVLH